MSFSLFGPSPFSEKCGHRRRHDAFQQWLQRHLYHCPTRSDVNAVAYAADVPREREGGRGGGTFLRGWRRTAAMHSPKSLRVRPSIARDAAPDERSPSWPAWKWSNAHERRASVIFLTFPVPLLFLSSFSFGRKSRIKDDGSNFGPLFKCSNIKLDMTLFQSQSSVICI